MNPERLKEVMKESHYQTFDCIGEGRRDSDSGKKYELSRLGAYYLQDANVLDIGCNSGYFLYRLLDKDPALLVGIDLGEKFIKVANILNQEHFKSNVVQFIFGDFFTYYFEDMFDFVICFSTFHYFDNQDVFFVRCHELMKDRAILILEVEEYPYENDISIINRDERPADKKRYYYPNRTKMEELVSGKFNILDRYISVKQGGSLYDRWFYKLQKV
jgi:SAM-dependent methyltransferase